MDDVRPEIMESASGMERKMQEHDKEKADSWKRMPVEELRSLLKKGWKEVTDAIGRLDYVEAMYRAGMDVSQTPEQVGKEICDKLLDLMNMSMMLRNRLMGEGIDG